MRTPGRLEQDEVGTAQWCMMLPTLWNFGIVVVILLGIGWIDADYCVRALHLIRVENHWCCKQIQYFEDCALWKREMRITDRWIVGEADRGRKEAGIYGSNRQMNSFWIITGIRWHYVGTTRILVESKNVFAGLGRAEPQIFKNGWNGALVETNSNESEENYEDL